MVLVNQMTHSVARVAPSTESLVGYLLRKFTSLIKPTKMSAYGSFNNQSKI